MAKFKILHADDVERWRLFVDDALSGDCEVESVKSCDEVLPHLANGGIDLVVLDMLMPGESPDASGFDVLQNIRQSHPNLPVVMFTGATEGTGVTDEELSEQWKVPIVFKTDDDAGTKLTQVVGDLLGSDS